MYKKIIFLSLAIVTFGFSAQAAGIQASPAKLTVSVPSGGRAQTGIVIANPTTDVQLFTVTSDDFTEAVRANPSSVTLQAGERRDIRITVDSSNLPKNESTMLATAVSVVGKPLADNRVAIGTGIKIPLTIVVENNAPRRRSPIPLFLLVAACFCVCAAITFRFVLKRKKSGPIG